MNDTFCWRGIFTGKKKPNKQRRFFGGRRGRDVRSSLHVLLYSSISALLHNLRTAASSAISCLLQQSRKCRFPQHLFSEVSQSESRRRLRERECPALYPNPPCNTCTDYSATYCLLQRRGAVTNNLRKTKPPTCQMIAAEYYQQQQQIHG